MKPTRRNRRILLIGLLLLLAGFLTGQRMAGEKPFQSLAAADIAAAEVELLPPEVTITLTREEIEELVPILNQVIIYRQDNSYSEYAGQAVIYTLTKTDGTRLRVQAYNPFIVINGVGYRTKYEPCQDLNSLGNQLNSDYR